MCLCVTISGIFLISKRKSFSTLHERFRNVALVAEKIVISKEVRPRNAFLLKVFCELLFGFLRFFFSMKCIDNIGFCCFRFAKCSQRHFTHYVGHDDDYDDDE